MAKNPKELVITRVFDVPRELAFRAWTDPVLVARWWGPEGVTNPVCEVDARPGGAIHIVMLAGKTLGELAGQRWPMSGKFKEVMPPKSIVYLSWAIEDEKGVPQLETTNTVTFEEAGGKTKMALRITVTKAGPGTEGSLSGMEQGWTQSIGKLGRLLSGEK